MAWNHAKLQIKQVVNTALGKFEDAYRAASISIPAAYRTGAWITDSSRIRHKRDSAKNAVYLKARQKTKGIPVLSSLAAAVSALRNFHAASVALKRRAKSLGATDAIYDSVTGHRWRFSEKYTVDAPTWCVPFTPNPAKPCKPRQISTFPLPKPHLAKNSAHLAQSLAPPLR